MNNPEGREMENNTHHLFTQLFIDFQTMHTYANSLYVEKDNDERERLIEAIDMLCDKWRYYVGKKVAKDVMDSLNENNPNGQ
jgi:hypothetical protein